MGYVISQIRFLNPVAQIASFQTDYATHNFEAMLFNTIQSLQSKGTCELNYKVLRKVADLTGLRHI